MKFAQKTGKFKHPGGTVVQADKEAYKPQSGQSKSDTTDWKRLFEDLQSSVEHNASEMQGHEHTWRSKYQRLLQIRDGRAREAHMRQLEKGVKHSDTSGGAAGGPYKSRSPQRDRRDHRERSRDGYTRDGRYAGLREGPREDHWRRGGDVGRPHDKHYGDSDDRYQQRDRTGGPQERSHEPQERERTQHRDQPPHHQSSRPPRSPSAERHPPDRDTHSHTRSQLSAGNASSSKCYNCDSTGHLARDCPQPSRGSASMHRRSASPSSRPRNE